MPDNKDTLLSKLRLVSLSTEEAKVYLELLQGSTTALQVSRITGIPRTTVYRIIDQLERQSLVTRHTDEGGTLLIAADPSTLEGEILTQEEQLRRKRAVLQSLIPELAALQTKSGNAFIVRTYEGSAGLKQMHWHELKTTGEIVALGNDTIEQLVADEEWALRHRERQIAAGYKTRNLVNREYASSELRPPANKQLIEAGLYNYRVLPPNILKFDSQTVIYNETVAIYYRKHGQKAGIEIINAAYAHMMRQIFEQYWQLAADN